MPSPWATRAGKGPSVSLGHTSPRTRRKMPCVMPSRCVDSPRRGTANRGIAMPTRRASRKSTLPTRRSRCPWRPSVASSSIVPPALLDPVDEEQVGLARGLAAAVAREHELRAVGREHREAVKGGLAGDALEPAAVVADQVEVERAAARVGVVAREDDALAVRVEIGRERGRAEPGHLALVPAIPVHHPELEDPGTVEALRQELAVAREARVVIVDVAAVDDALAVRREE